MPVMELSASQDRAFFEAVCAKSGQDLLRCYQCGNCTAGCPMQPYYDLAAHQVMRLVQTGQRKAALTCSSLWLCAGCGQCSARCPNQLDVALILETLRHMARRAGYNPQPRVAQFSRAFLKSVHSHGRVFELGLLLRYKLASGRLLDDADLAPRLLKVGKLHLTPTSTPGQAEVAAIFRRYEQGAGS